MSEPVLLGPGNPMTNITLVLKPSITKIENNFKIKLEVKVKDHTGSFV